MMAFFPLQGGGKGEELGGLGPAGKREKITNLMRIRNTRGVCLGGRGRKKKLVTI